MAGRIKDTLEKLEVLCEREEIFTGPAKHSQLTISIREADQRCEPLAWSYPFPDLQPPSRQSSQLQNGGVATTKVAQAEQPLSEFGRKLQAALKVGKSKACWQCLP